jgi:hypothetical protein
MDHRLALQPALVALSIALASPMFSTTPAAAADQFSIQQKDDNATASERRGEARSDFMSLRH